MNYLLDTHTLLWIVREDKKLSSKVKRIYLNSSNEIFVSAVTIWEIAIKTSLNKLAITQSLSSFVDEHITGNNIRILDITSAHVIPLAKLPYHHRDPFDRLIVTQALHENMILISKDKVFDNYLIKRVWS